jgi:hypothetical protein
MTRAAELRACGWSWAAIGKELGCDERFCRLLRSLNHTPAREV